MAQEPTSELLQAWRKATGRSRGDFGTRSLTPARERLSLRERRAVSQLAARVVTPSDGEQLSDIGEQLLAPEHALRAPRESQAPLHGSNGAKASVLRGRTEQQRTRQLLSQHRAEASRRDDVSRRKLRNRQREIAKAPEALRIALIAGASKADAAEARRRGFTLSTHTEPAKPEGGTITPRHEKQAYLESLDRAASIGRISPQWLRQRCGPHPREGLADLPPIDPATADVATINDELQRRSAAKAARRGLPPVDGFTELSEAISAVVASSKAGRMQAPPRPLCGDTMTYWDRVNFFNRFQESCAGGNEHDLRSTIPKLRARR